MKSLWNRARSAARKAFSPTILACAMATGLVGMALTAATPALAAPEPSPIPKRWQLEITTSPLRTTVVGNRAYFFMTYKVTNNSPQDLLFAPAFELATDEGSLLRSGRDVPIEVTREMLSRLASPLIEDQISIVGTLLRGPENAKQGVVIWPVPQQHLTEVAVYCAGFSGETAPVEIANPKTGQMEKKLLRKSWMMRYTFPGEFSPSSGDSFEPGESRWIMR